MAPCRQKTLADLARRARGRSRANRWPSCCVARKSQPLNDYFKQRYQELRGQGYGIVLTHRAQVVTRRHLIWLEHEGHLADGCAALEVAKVGPRALTSSEALFEKLVVKVDNQLPQGLRQPVVAYLEHLVHERGLCKKTISKSLRANLALCWHLATAGQDCFTQLRAAQVDQVVISLLSAPADDLLRRRRQVQTQHSSLRGFLRYLSRSGLLARDLARVLISPPCYRASKPPVVLSEREVSLLLAAVNRGDARGRRCHAVLLLMTTYGLRPIDVATLRLTELHWRTGQIALVQQKTGRTLTLPLLPEVAAALADYLHHDRLRGWPHAQVFGSLHWPHRPIRSGVISAIVTAALREAGLGQHCARHLRPTVATHLLRQGEALSTIQELLGHRVVETTQRYARADVVLLREVLEEAER